VQPRIEAFPQLPGADHKLVAGGTVREVSHQDLSATSRTTSALGDDRFGRGSGTLAMDKHIGTGVGQREGGGPADA
jgi:hypothetical protein